MSDDILQEFLLESRENLDQLDRELVGLEAEPSNTARLASVFRTVHTIKGTAGFFQFTKLEAVAHGGESLLSKLRDGQIVLETVRTTGLLGMVDAIRALLLAIESKGNESGANYDRLSHALALACDDGTLPEAAKVLEAIRRAEHGSAPSHFVAPSVAELEPAEEAVPVAETVPPVEAVPSAVPPSSPRVHVFPAPPAPAVPSVPASSPRVHVFPAPPAAPSAASSPNVHVFPERPAAAEAPSSPRVQIFPQPPATGSLPKPPLPAAPPAAAPPAAAPPAAAPHAAAPHAAAEPHEKRADARSETRGTDQNTPQDARIRVDVRLLDKLMNLVGELVLARNQMLQHASNSNDAGLVSSSQRLNLITTELQEGVMKTRMQPIDTIWSKFPRVVRDLSQLCGKQVKLEMEGKATELDKTIIEAINDPLTHLVRNSVDHGIELPSVRVAAGKPPGGTLKLRAFHEGGRVNIEIVDDGGGIDTERVKAKAMERGLITLDRARSMPMHEVYGLLFLPGFSTAAAVTNISGRGVGMDVVKSNIERMGGTVDIDSRLGAGTTIRIRIPLTLAIIPALVVGACGERFAIPQVNLVELVRLEADQAALAIERIHGVPVFRLRGNLLVLAELSRVLGLETDTSPRDVNIVVLQADERQFGLLVDDIYDTEEIVVKPLGRELKGLNVYAGATIMGDGRVALILDVAGLAERTGVVPAERRGAHEAAVYGPGRVDGPPKEPLLLFRSGTSARMAIPLRAVARLEEFARNRVERVGREQVVQYRGEILPLVYLSKFFGEEGRDNDPLQVVVHTFDGRNVGFVVDSIEDVVEEEFTATRRGGRSGILGSAVIQGHVTELLDAEALRDLAGGV